MILKLIWASDGMLASVVQREEYMNRSGSRGGGSAVLRAEWDQTENLIGLESQFCHINLVELFNHLEFYLFFIHNCLIRALTSALHSIVEKFK